MSQNFNVDEDLNLRREALKMQCPDCKGIGKIINKKRLSISTSPKAIKKGLYNSQDCFRCKGTGKMDWIEMATGKK